MDKAIRDYYKIIEIAPKYAEVYYNLGTTYSEIGDLDRALSNLNKAIELNPGNSAAYHNRAVVYSKKGDTVSAMQDLAMEAKVMQQRRRVPASPKYLNGLYQGLFKAYVDGVLEIYTNRTWLLAHLDDFKAKFGEDVTLDQARRAIDGHETFHALMHVLRLQSQELLASIDNDTEEELADLLEIAFVKNTVKIPERLIPAVKIIERALNIRLQSEDNPIDLIEYIQNFDPYDAADPKALERLLDSIGIRVTVIDKTPAEIAEIKAKAESPQARAVGVKVEKDVGGIDYQQGLNIQEKGRGIKINDMPSNLNFDPAGLKGFKVEIIGLERRNREV
jgi:tetratricopeptide (TPR) repeat protein